MSGKEQEEGHACMLGLGKQVMFPVQAIGACRGHASTPRADSRCVQLESVSC